MFTRIGVRPGRPIGLASVIAAIGIAAAAAPAPAAQLTFYYQGTITAVTDPSAHLNGSVAIGGAISGSYTFDTGALDNDFVANVGRYRYDATAALGGPPDGMTMTTTVGDYSFATFNHTTITSSSEITVRDNFVFTVNPTDQYFVETHEIDQTGGPALPLNLTLHGGQILFSLATEANLGTFTDTLLPLTPPSLAPFEIRAFKLTLGTTSGTFPVIDGTITALSASPLVAVPAPGTLASLTLLTPLLLARRRGRR